MASRQCCSDDARIVETNGSDAVWPTGVSSLPETRHGASDAESTQPTTTQTATPDGSTSATAVATGSLVAAVLASVCCLGPVLLAALGVGAGAVGSLAGTAGFMRALLPYRPVFMGLALLLLGAGFYLVYRRPREAREAGMSCALSPALRRTRVVLWAIAGVATLLLLAPYWLAWLSE